MKKIFSIVLALVLALSLSLATATSVVANVSDVSVGVSPDTVGTKAQYAINFTITKSLAIADTISIRFPEGTTVPDTYKTGDVTVEGENISFNDISVAGQVVTITLPDGIGAIQEVNVVFNVTAGITNPASPSDYRLEVQTSKESNWVESADYTICLSGKSTYEFVYELPEKIWVNEPAAVNVTLQTDVKGLDGYDPVKIVFNLTDQPEEPCAVTFQVYYKDKWEPPTPFEDDGYWPPLGGNSSVLADDAKTIPFRLTFDAIGLYTIKFELIDVEHDEVLEADEISFAVTGVSVNVTLNKGWNLMSLPIVPDDDDIADVLADIMGNVTSVHHYDAASTATDKWLIYSLDPDFHSLTTMEDGNAYWINMKAAANLTVVGQAIAAPGIHGGVPSTYPVVEGWNMVGFKSTGNMTAGEYLYGTDPVRIYGFDFDEGGWFSLTTGQNMTPGLGYWVAFSEAGTIYP